MKLKQLLWIPLLIGALSLLGALTALGQEKPDQDPAGPPPTALDASAPADQVILDDMVVDGSLCVGLDCINNELFGFDTIILKENNLRIFFNDTSTSASFPTNDWRITINDSANGGSSYFRIDDVTANQSTLTIRSGGKVGIGTDNPDEKLHVAGNVKVNGTVIELSDANAKEDFAPVAGAEVLERLSRIPMTTWSYKNDAPGVRHIGPTAQDFYAAFGLGGDERHIAAVDRDGVALAAIQQLTLELREKEERIGRLERENRELAARYYVLEARLAALESRLSGGADE